MVLIMLLTAAIIVAIIVAAIFLAEITDSSDQIKFGPDLRGARFIVWCGEKQIGKTSRWSARLALLIFGRKNSGDGIHDATRIGTPRQWGTYRGWGIVKYPEPYQQ